MKFSKHLFGKYATYAQASHHSEVEKWIIESKFLNYEKEDLILKKKSRKRNKLYCFHFEDISKDVTMKVSQVSKHYKFFRRLNLFVTSLLKDYNRNSYRISINLLESGVETMLPIAYWTYQTSWLNRKTYFLYEKVDSELAVTELLAAIKKSNLTNKTDLINSIADKHMSIIRSIHKAHIRHDDPHGGNILTSIRINEVEKLSISDIEQSKFTLIDNDRGTFTRSLTKTQKTFFDMKCLTKFNITDIPTEDVLKKYFGKDYHPAWLLVLRFWRSGGFNIKNRIYYLFKIKHLYQ